MPVKLTTEEFISRSRRVHGDKYDYSMVEYIHSHSKAKIICPVHGVFEQILSNHMNGQGCKKCGIIDRSNSRRTPTNTFINKAKQVHGDKYSYDLVEYVNNRTKVKIICPVHGVFEQRPYLHYNGSGCIVCGGSDKHTTNTFINKAKQVHGDKYSYDLVEYVNNKIPVNIICHVHGVFEQRPDNHFQNQCCPECMKKTSHQEMEFVEYIKSLYNGSIITNTRSVIPPYELDVYLPDRHTAFEYNGDYWHQEGVTKPVGYHQMKTDMCIDKGVKLHHIWESDWIDNRDGIKERIKEVVL